jgi:hypothetical protein
VLAAYDQHPSQGLLLATALGCKRGSLRSPANLGVLIQAGGGGPPALESQSLKDRPPFVAGGRGMRVEGAGASVHFKITGSEEPSTVGACMRA